MPRLGVSSWTRANAAKASDALSSRRVAGGLGDPGSSRSSSVRTWCVRNLILSTNNLVSVARRRRTSTRATLSRRRLLARRTLNDTDRAHHAFVLVLEDVAVEH